MSWRRILVALVACAALGGLYFYDVQHREGAGVTRLADSRLVPPEFDPKLLTRVEIDNHLTDDPRLEHLAIDLKLDPDSNERSEIRVRKPYDRPADENVVIAGFLENLWRAKRSNVFEGTPSHGNGLDQPAIVARFFHGDPDLDSPFELHVGARSNYTGNFFAWASDRPGEIFTVNEFVYNKLSAPGIVYIDRRLIRIPGIHDHRNIVFIAVENGHGRAELHAGRDKTWELRMTDTSGETTTRSADPAVVGEFARALAQRGAISTLDPSPALQLGTTYARVEISDGLTTHSVTVGAKYEPDPQYRLALRDDAEYFLVLRPEVYEELQLPPVHWLDRTLMPVTIDKLQRLVVAGPDGETAIVRLPAEEVAPGALGWGIEGHPARLLAPKPLGKFLNQLCGLRASGVSGYSSPEMTHQVRSLYFSGKDMVYLAGDGETTHALRISGGHEDDHFYALRADDPTIYHVPLATALALRVDGADLLDPAMLAASAEAAERIVFTGREATVELRRDRSELNPGWTSPDLARESATELARRVFGLQSTTPLPPGAEQRLFAKPIYGIELFGADAAPLDRLEAFAPIEGADELQLRVRLADGTLLLSGRTDFSLMDLLVQRGRKTPAN